MACDGTVNFDHILAEADISCKLVCSFDIQSPQLLNTVITSVVVSSVWCEVGYRRYA